MARVLTDDEVRELLALRRQGWKRAALAEYFRVPEDTVKDIYLRRRRVFTGAGRHAKKPPEGG